LQLFADVTTDVGGDKSAQLSSWHLLIASQRSWSTANRSAQNVPRSWQHR